MNKERTNSLFLALFFVVFLVISCCHDTIMPEVPRTATLTFRTIESPSEKNTKAGFGPLHNGSYPVLWDDADVAGVTLDYASSFVSSSILSSEDKKTGTFTATLAAPAAGSFKVQAVVPASRIVSYNAVTSDITLNIPASQTPTATGPDPSAMMLVANIEMDAVPESDEEIFLPFHHATAYGCLTLKNLPTAAEIHSIDLLFSVPVSGKWDYDPENLKMTEKIPANIITVHTNSVENVFFGCAPAALHGETLKVRLNTEAGMYEVSVDVTSSIQFKAGYISRFTVDMASAMKKQDISVIPIGNSFTSNACTYLDAIIKDAGYNPTIYKIAFGGHDLSGLVSKYKSGDEKYLPLIENKADFVTLQQLSQMCGLSYTFYPYLDQMIDIVRTHQPQAKLVWHITWAYEEDSPNSNFAYYYGSNQQTMYDAIMDVFQKDVQVTGVFGDFIPCGTMIQNLRSSPLAGRIAATDGVHMGTGPAIGCYALGLSWCRTLTGVSVDGITYKLSSMTSEELDYIKEAVENAYWAPFVVTPYIPPAPTGPQEMDQNPDFNPPFSPEGEW